LANLLIYAVFPNDGILILNPVERAMDPAERRATFGLAAIFGLRMLGLFLILPVFTLYGDELSGSTPMLIGLAIGAYGLTQALLQIPMGVASDRWGRRPVIMLGLLLFVAGSVLAAVSTSIYWVIAGRALQGAGAIAAAVMALAADLTRYTQPPKALAVIGLRLGSVTLLTTHRQFIFQFIHPIPERCEPFILSDALSHKRRL
jgi:MFS family permease